MFNIYIQIWHIKLLALLHFQSLSKAFLSIRVIFHMNVNKNDIKINDNINFSDYTETLLNKGRVQIHNFFTDTSAKKLQKLLVEHSQWYLAYNEFNNFYEIPFDKVESISSEAKTKFMDALYQRAENNFQYVFKQFIISQAIQLNEESPINFIDSFVNSTPFLNAMRTITNDKGINWADSIASSYAPGHFLTNHDDIHNKNDRVVAYTIGMTEDWDPNWGGNLVFFDKNNNIEEGFLPRFNTLSVFTIPQQHAVQLVAPFANKERLSLLGWANR